MSNFCCACKPTQQQTPFLPSYAACLEATQGTEASCSTARTRPPPAVSFPGAGWIKAGQEQRRCFPARSLLPSAKKTPLWCCCWNTWLDLWWWVGWFWESVTKWIQETRKRLRAVTPPTGLPCLASGSHLPHSVPPTLASLLLLQPARLAPLGLGILPVQLIPQVPKWLALLILQALPSEAFPDHPV